MAPNGPRSLERGIEIARTPQVKALARRRAMRDCVAIATRREY
jgi:hypothetical protein